MGYWGPIYPIKPPTSAQGGLGEQWPAAAEAAVPRGRTALQPAVDLQTGIRAYHCTSDAIYDVIIRMRCNKEPNLTTHLGRPGI